LLQLRTDILLKRRNQMNALRRCAVRCPVRCATRLAILSAISVFSLASVPPRSAAQAPTTTYSYSTFPVPEAAPATPSSLSVDAITDGGVIAGAFLDTSGNTKGFQRSANGDITVLVDPLDQTTPTYTQPWGENNEGIVVGWFYDTAADTNYGFFYSNGQYTTYTPPGETNSIVDGVSNSGANFCGAYLVSNEWHSFIVLNGKLITFQVGPGDYGCLTVNNAGNAIGTYYDSAGVLHGWYRNAATGKISTISYPGASTVVGNDPCYGNVAGTYAYGLNDSGEVSGRFWDSTNLSHGFTLSPQGVFTQLDVPNANETGGGGINDLGQVVGHWSDSSCDNYGYIATPN
jgi:hypothetical protein